MKRHGGDLEKQSDHDKNEGEDRKKLENGGVEVQRDGEPSRQQLSHRFALNSGEMAESNSVHQIVAKCQCIRDSFDVRGGAEAVQNREAIGQDSGAQGADQNEL